MHSYPIWVKNLLLLLLLLLFKHICKLARYSFRFNYLTILYELHNSLGNNKNNNRVLLTTQYI